MRLLLGLFIAVFNTVLLGNIFSKNEWRLPLLELNAELKRKKLSNMHTKAKKRMIITSFLPLIFFIIGGFMIWGSSFGQEYEVVILLILGIILLRNIKAVYELIRAGYSKKTKLLNYLYSPYLFAWRRDSLGKYSDYEIANAILDVCDINKNNFLLKKDLELDDFLINLHQKVRSPREHKEYPETLRDNIKKAKQMRRR